MDRESVLAVAAIGFGVAAVVGVGLLAKSYFSDPSSIKKKKKGAKKTTREQEASDEIDMEEPEDDDFDDDEALDEMGNGTRNKVVGKASSGGFQPPFEAPPGYEWYYNDVFFCATIKPEGWKVEDDPKKGMFMIYQPKPASKVSKRPVPQDSLTGLTVSCFPRQKPDWPVTFMGTFKKQLKDEKKQIREDWHKEEIHSGFDKYSLMFSETTTEPIQVYCQLIHNKKTGTVYFCIWECKERDYEEMWEQYGAPLTACMLFHPKL